MAEFDEEKGNWERNRAEYLRKDSLKNLYLVSCKHSENMYFILAKNSAQAQAKARDFLNMSIDRRKKNLTPYTLGDFITCSIKRLEGTMRRDVKAKGGCGIEAI